MLFRGSSFLTALGASLVLAGCFVDQQGLGPSDGGNGATSSGGSASTGEGGSGGAASTSTDTASTTTSSTTTAPEGTPCDADTDCPSPDACLVGTCPKGVCVYAPKAQGTPVQDLSETDCIQQVCDGSGHTTDVPDTAEIPNDGDPCTTDYCDQMTPIHEPKAPLSLCQGDPGTCSACIGGACTEIGGGGVSFQECGLITCISGVVEATTVDALCLDDPTDCKVPFCSAMGACDFMLKDVNAPCGPTGTGKCKMNGTCMF